MKGKRLWHTVRLYTAGTDKKRSDYLKKHNVFRNMGENVSLNIKICPLYPKLISFHNNIKVATGVLFITHDVIATVLNTYDKDFHYLENIGCIEIHDNCFIGAKSVIMPGVSIGPNAIVAAGAVVTKDVEPGTIVGGVPAHKIGTFDDYIKKSQIMSETKRNLDIPRNEEISDERIEAEWKLFLDSRLYI